MKIRNGFVSNSSTSSFVCYVCDEIFMLMDGDPEDNPIDLAVCENGHGFCREHLLWTDEEQIQLKKRYLKDFSTINDKELSIKANLLSLDGEQFLSEFNEQMENDEGLTAVHDFNCNKIDPKYCPFCQFKNITEWDLNNYLEVRPSIKEDMLKEIKEIYNNYGHFISVVNNKLKEKRNED